MLSLIYLCSLFGRINDRAINYPNDRYPENLRIFGHPYSNPYSDNYPKFEIKSEYPDFIRILINVTALLNEDITFACVHYNHLCCMISVMITQSQ